jgi:hypothetical protein
LRDCEVQFSVVCLCMKQKKWRRFEKSDIAAAVLSAS